MTQRAPSLPWLPCEDQYLLQLYKESRDWDLIAQKIPRHSKAACRTRHSQLLHPKPKKPRKIKAITPKQHQPPTTAAYKPWTPEESQQLIAEVAQGLDFDAIALAHGRSHGACMHQHRLLTLEERTQVRVQAQARQAPPPRASTEVEHHSLTAAFCGDPLPGRSALDKMRAGITPPPDPTDRRSLQTRPKPTLAQGVTL